MRAPTAGRTFPVRLVSPLRFRWSGVSYERGRARRCGAGRRHRAPRGRRGEGKRRLKRGGGLPAGSDGSLVVVSAHLDGVSGPASTTMAAVRPRCWKQRCGYRRWGRRRPAACASRSGAPRSGRSARAIMSKPCRGGASAHRALHQPRHGRLAQLRPLRSGVQTRPMPLGCHRATPARRLSPARLDRRAHRRTQWVRRHLVLPEGIPTVGLYTVREARSRPRHERVRRWRVARTIPTITAPVTRSRTSTASSWKEHARPGAAPFACPTRSCVAPSLGVTSRA
jgi:hypothetical protein